nr:MAG TPA: hypothetical protein [Caudoviricetes sp.]
MSSLKLQDLELPEFHGNITSLQLLIMRIFNWR